MKNKPWHEPIEPTKRRPMSKARAKRITEAAGGVCYLCGSPDGPFDIEHPISLWMGGADDDSELRPVCRLSCHKVKSATDSATRAKVRSLINAEAGIKPKFVRKIQSPGFRKGGPKAKWPKNPDPWQKQRRLNHH